MYDRKFDGVGGYNFFIIVYKYVWFVTKLSLQYRVNSSLTAVCVISMQ